MTSNPDDAESIFIDGTQGAEGAALILDDDRAVTIDGLIVVRDRSSNEVDADIFSLDQAVGIKIDTDFTGSNLSLERGLNIDISEILGPQDNDADEDGIIEGSQAMGTAQRIGLWVDADITGSLIGEGGFIRVDGNNARGVQIDNLISGNFDFSTAIDRIIRGTKVGGILGDNAIGVDINGSIIGYYRQRGDIDVRGEGSVGIDIGAAITGALLIESQINATGYSGAPSPQRGVDESGLTAAQQTANQNERRRGGAAVSIGAAVGGGVIIGGFINRLVSEDERDAVDAINARRSDEDNTNDNVVSLKTDPYHFDENRALGQISTYGEADGEASLKITDSVGSANGATREVLLDTRDDDDDDTAASDSDEADFYDSTGEFFFSHGLINRGLIKANSWYDAVKSGDDYQIDTKATALLIDSATGSVHGGVYNSGTISATAFNSNAIALDFVDVDLTDGIRNNDTVFLNEGILQAEVATDERSHDGVSLTSNMATAVKFHPSVSFDLQGTRPVFANAGEISAQYAHVQQQEGQDDDSGLYERVCGTNHFVDIGDCNRAVGNFNLNGIAIDFSEVTGDIDLEQAFLQNDTTLSANVDGNAGDETVYRGSGDLDRDSNDDGVVDLRDMASQQMSVSIIGDILFNDADNDFTMTAGTVNGLIDFGDGTHNFHLGNATDDDSNGYRTGFRGRIANSGTLNIITGGQTAVDGETVLLHFDGQEGVDLNQDGDDQDANEELDLSVNDLQLAENAELRFSI
ncbi:MAG: hypothetical protein L7U47_03335, partial [Alphaproteobacteria bacterium]|nr:hypothetical protein [Alphaproteobacteria bacterium]